MKRNKIIHALLRSRDTFSTVLTEDVTLDANMISQSFSSTTNLKFDGEVVFKERLVVGKCGDTLKDLMLRLNQTLKP